MAQTKAKPAVEDDWAPQHRVLPVWFDFKTPEYGEVFRVRVEALRRIREHGPSDIKALKAYYRDNPADFINDWGVTFDPRLVEQGLPGIIPFVLFDRQRDYIDWVMARWKEGRPGLCEKSRDCGVSWLNIALACTLCLFHDGMVIGFGSRKEEYVDKIGNRKALFPKGRMFMQHLPPEFRGGWRIERDAPYMRLSFPETQSSIGGEAGDNIGRGDRASIYMVDEAAHLERAQLVEEALSQTTRCRIDVSSVKGMNNVFAQKRHSGRIDVFVFDHRDDPRKGPAWYAQQQEDLDEVTLAQEVDRDYLASTEGMVIPGKWVRASIDALQKLGIAPTGQRLLAFDVADEGIDANAVCGAYGVSVDFLEEWSGKGEDIFKTTERVVRLCDAGEWPAVRYDADGLGAGVRGDARIINERRRASGLRQITFDAFRGSEAVHDPEGYVYPDQKDKTGARRNKDFFANRKAQGWWSLRDRFQRTFRWVTDAVRCNADQIISISSACQGYLKLVTELSQPTYSVNGAGKIVIDKKPDGVKSPNLADAVMIRFVTGKAPMHISDALLRKALTQGSRPR